MRGRSITYIQSSFAAYSTRSQPDGTRPWDYVSQSLIRATGQDVLSTFDFHTATAVVTV